jgi:hypothetical protein
MKPDSPLFLITISGNLNGVTNPKVAADWSKGTPADWATDTLQVAKKAYCLPGISTVMPSGTKIGDDYFQHGAAGDPETAGEGRSSGGWGAEWDFQIGVIDEVSHRDLWPGTVADGTAF